MDISLSWEPAQNLECDLLVIPVTPSELLCDSDRSVALRALDDALDGVLLKAAAAEGFGAKAESVFEMHTLGRAAARKVALLGMGTCSADFRMACGKAVKAASKKGAVHMVVAMPSFMAMRQLKAAAEGLALGAYRFNDYRTGKAGEPSSLAKVTLALPDSLDRDECGAVLAGALSLADAVNFARHLVDEPPERMTPAILGEEARRMGEACGLGVEVLEGDAIAAKGMEMFLAVARGSAQAPRLIHVSWTPPDPGDAAKPALALVGKSITFDAGGLSLKTSPGMVWMKTDMAGGAAVLGAMKAVASIKPRFPVHAWLAACENMPGGDAYRLGDILKSHTGKTVEVCDTDAEGRLTLADALGLACDMKPAAVVDLATLTGAVAVALGLNYAGLFVNDADLERKVVDAARRAGEDMWKLPLDDRMRGELDSPVADLKNLGERYGGAISAAIFLKEFVGETSWAHLDIAGTCRSKVAKGYMDVGATGYGVMTLAELVLGWEGDGEAA